MLACTMASSGSGPLSEASQLLRLTAGLVTVTALKDFHFVPCYFSSTKYRLAGPIVPISRTIRQLSSKITAEPLMGFPFARKASITRLGKTRSFEQSASLWFTFLAQMARFVTNAACLFGRLHRVTFSLRYSFRFCPLAKIR